MQITNYEVTKGGVEKTSIIQSTTFEIPTNIMRRRNSGRVREKKHGWKRQLIPIFMQNELAKRKDKLTDTHIKSWMLRHFYNVKTIVRNIELYRYTVGLFRTWYNETRLTSDQETPVLISLSYSEDGYPIIGAYKGRSFKDYIYFEECYTRCALLKIADPRFVEYEKIVEIRNKLVQRDPEWIDWIVPTDDQLKKIASTLGYRKIEQLYNSVAFPKNYTREATPKDFIPFKYYEDLMSDL